METLCNLHSAISICTDGFAYCIVHKSFRSHDFDFAGWAYGNLFSGRDGSFEQMRRLFHLPERNFPSSHSCAREGPAMHRVFEADRTRKCTFLAGVGKRELGGARSHAKGGRGKMKIRERRRKSYNTDLSLLGDKERMNAPFVSFLGTAHAPPPPKKK